MASTKNRDILLVGSMRLASAEDVFRTVASILGDKVHATECGFGRRPRAQDIRELLGLHTQIAAL